MKLVFLLLSTFFLSACGDGFSVPPTEPITHNENIGWIVLDKQSLYIQQRSE